MSTWTTVKGYPFVKVLKEEWEAAQVTITLEQAWFHRTAPGGPEAPCGYSPFLRHLAGQQQRHGRDHESEAASFVIPLGNADDFVKINAGQIVLARVAHSSR